MREEKDEDLVPEENDKDDGRMVYHNDHDYDGGCGGCDSGGGSSSSGMTETEI